ncbi:hypothetical protein H4696_001131 [Amycolatopsis lexingtonensis]|uniref:UspA domain-containing protein n=1 Tax=Amycolatopsis lexingtonensis TaxID=218822 RepID=A0ABR9HSX9_9PSEU|nr:universal stress protein [Amycolatopsis lexingtonensis]MBE1494031.1 hypothetical protein [Amycolatopsis lexingtonensis]
MARCGDVEVPGSRGLGGFTGLVAGSVAVAVTSHGHCPVVVVRGVDGSPSDTAAIPFAFQAADARGVPLVAVRTWMDQAIAIGWAAAPATNRTAIRDEQRRLLGKWLEPYRTRYPGVLVQPQIATDRPAPALLEHARTAQHVTAIRVLPGGFRCGTAERGAGGSSGSLRPGRSPTGSTVDT